MASIAAGQVSDKINSFTASKSWLAGRAAPARRTTVVRRRLIRHWPAAGRGLPALPFRPTYHLCEGAAKAVKSPLGGARKSFSAPRQPKLMEAACKA